MRRRAVLRACGPRTARVTLILLMVSSGMFQAATTLLPSTFAMYAATAASAAVLEGRPLPGASSSPQISRLPPPRPLSPWDDPAASRFAAFGGRAADTHGMACERECARA